jgi:hypothetical protein
MKEEATLENYDAKFEQAIRGLAKELAEYADVTYEQVMRLGEQTIYLLWHELHGYDPVCDEPPYEKIRRYVADDEKRLQEKENANKLRVLVAEPHKRAYVKTIVNSLEEMQKLVDGLIEPIYFDPTNKAIAFCNEEFLINGSEPNRFFSHTIIHGTFFIVGNETDENGEQRVCSLTDEQVELFDNFLKRLLML